MAEGGHKDEYTYPSSEDDMEWYAECRWNIKDVRSLYSSVDYYMEIWPGEPDRPKEEKKFLTGFKENLFRMIADYNYTHHVIEESDIPNPDGT